MPLIEASSFIPPLPFRNGHYSTFVPYLLGSFLDINYARERIDTPDEDFLDIDFLKGGYNRAAILCHGLEGSSNSSYVKILSERMFSEKWDVAAMNFRGCSGEINKKLKMYNSGTTEDLHTVVSHVSKSYDEIVLIGVSLGGNLILKYLGEDRFPLSTKVKSGIAVSAPIDLRDASLALLTWDNILYQLNFIPFLYLKVWAKARQFPQKIKMYQPFKARNFYTFDHYYTAPLGGYDGADDYYVKCSALQYIPTIPIPTLLLNALDDPFLGTNCHPHELAQSSELFHLKVPKYGGHVGFARSRNDRSYLLDSVAKFAEEVQ